MIKQFFIKKICSQSVRPAYSFLIDEYLEDFINEYILKHYGIINGGKWSIWLAMMIDVKGTRGPQGVYVFNKPTTVSGEMVKFYPIKIPYEEVFKNSDVVKNIVNLYIEGICEFFILNYRKVKPEYLKGIIQKLDWDYIYSIAYPVDIMEQKYIGDIPDLNIRQI